MPVGRAGCPRPPSGQGATPEHSRRVWTLFTATRAWAVLEDRTDAAHRGSPSPTPGGAPHGAPPAPALGRRRRAAPPHAAHAPRPLGAPASGLRRVRAGPRRARGRRRCQPTNRKPQETPGLPANPSGFFERRALGFRRSAGPAPGVPRRAAAAAGEWSVRGAGPGLAGWACRPWKAVLRCLAATAGGAAGTRAAPAGGPVQSRGCAGGGRWSPGVDTCYLSPLPCSQALDGFCTRLCPSPLPELVPGLSSFTLAVTPWRAPFLSRVADGKTEAHRDEAPSRKLHSL